MATKKRKPRRTCKSADEIIEDIGRFFNRIKPYVVKDHQEAEKLWAVFSAFRGPDPIELQITNTLQIKRATTSVIRYAVSPAIGKVGVDVAPDSRESKKVRAKLKSVEGHFTQHAYLAFKALGLDW